MYFKIDAMSSVFRPKETGVVYNYNLREHYLDMKRSTDFEGSIQKLKIKNKEELKEFFKDQVARSEVLEKNFLKKITSVYKFNQNNKPISTMRDYLDYLEYLAKYGYNKPFNTIQTTLNTVIDKGSGTKFDDLRRMKQMLNGGYDVSVLKTNAEPQIKLLQEYLNAIKKLYDSNSANQEELDYMLSYVKALEDKLEKMQPGSITPSNVKGEATEFAFGVARAYEAHHALVIASLDSAVEDIFFFGKKGQTQKGKKIDDKTIDINPGANFQIDKVIRHADSVVKVGGLSNTFYITTDSKSSLTDQYSYRQSDSLQKILVGAVDSGIINGEDFKKIVYGFVNMVNFEPEVAENLDNFNEFIRISLVMNFAKDYLDHYAQESMENQVPVIAIGNSYFSLTELINSFAKNYLSKQEKTQSKVQIPRTSGRGSLLPDKNGKVYLNSGDFKKLLKDKRDTIQQIKEEKRITKENTKGSTNEKFYQEVYEATRDYHKKLSHAVLHKKQPKLLSFKVK
jgi:hypothetical protein